VIIYKGHALHPLFGPYRHGLEQRIDMFTKMHSWKVKSVFGEQLVPTLKAVDPRKTLLVISAGESLKLNTVFAQDEIYHIRHEFLEKGGRCYLPCGAAYWASQKRIYENVLRETTKLPLFPGVAQGPLSAPDAVQIHNGIYDCTVFVGGGGSFLPEQGVRVLARYSHAELTRIGIKKEEHAKRENAAIAVPIGKGAALLAMFHPYYGADDIDPPAYQRAFSGYQTDWRAVKSRLSSVDLRIRFVYDMICKLY